MSEGPATAFKKDPVELRVRVVPAAVLTAAPAILRRLASDYPDFDTEHLPVSEVMVAGKGALRFEFESVGRSVAKDAPRLHVVALLVPLGTHTLFVSTALDAAKWAAAEKDVQAAVSGFFFWD